MQLDEETDCRLLQKETAFGGSTITLSPPTAGPSSSYQNWSPNRHAERRGQYRTVMSACPSPTHSIQSQVPCYSICGMWTHAVACRCMFHCLDHAIQGHTQHVNITDTQVLRSRCFFILILGNAERYYN
jgi:hypothetical protein